MSPTDAAPRANAGPKTLPDPMTLHPYRFPDGRVIVNNVLLQPAIVHPNITVGRYAYAHDFDPPSEDTGGWAGRLAPYLYPGAPERLTIGAFTQIAHGVRFVTASANHPMRGLSTYPFRIHEMETTGPYIEEAALGGDTVIGPDVWLGMGACVMPGVTIGAGAIIAAHSVVTRDVPPYAVVAGNPGRVVRLRFEQGVIDRLLELSWWEWPAERIMAALPAIEGGDIDALAQG